jgi:hypothetical protein
MRTALLCILVLVSLTQIGVAAERPCSERKLVVDFLRRAHGEFPVGRGLSSGGRIVEVFASGAGSWTVIWSSPTGTSCVVASGEGWEQSKAEVATLDRLRVPADPVEYSAEAETP